MWAHVFGGITPFSVGLVYNSIFFLAVRILSHFGTRGTVGFLALLTFFFPLLLFGPSLPVSFWHH